MSVNKLKLILTEEPGEENIPFMIVDGSTSWEGEIPVLAYYKDQTFYVLNKGGSERVSLVTCRDLKNILDSYMFKGTKYIASTYNPTLYYLFPGFEQNDNLFKTENNFIPTIPITDSNLIRMEVDGFDPVEDLGYSTVSPTIAMGTNGNWYINGHDTGRKIVQDKIPYIYKSAIGKWFVDFNSITQEEVRCMKACDSWFNDLSKYEELVEAVNERIESVFGYYKDFEVDKEVSNKEGSYSTDLSIEPLVVSLISETTYTDTINLEDWVLSSKKGTNTISGKLDISYMYSIGSDIYSGMQTIKAFQYEENVTSRTTIISLGDIQIEYMDYVLKIYPMKEKVDEVVFTDCTLTIGVL